MMQMTESTSSMAVLFVLYDKESAKMNFRGEYDEMELAR
jgi:hypothetical protein